MPETSVPVATVPKPFTVKTRSMGRRKWPAASFSGARRRPRAPAACRSSSSPAPVTELTGTTGAPSRNEPATSSSTSSRTSAENVGIHQVGLGQRDHAARNPQQPADIEVLAGLRLDGFVGRDDEQHQVDAAHAGQHVLDEALVAGHVHEAQPQVGRQLQVGEAQVDGDAAALLFLQAVGVDAGQRLDQRGLAVIDVAGGADDDVLHGAGSMVAGRASGRVLYRVFNCSGSTA